MQTEGQMDHITVLRTMTQLRKEREALSKQAKAMRAKEKEMEEHMINAMIGIRRVWIDASGNLEGPFWTLTKEKHDGTWNEERYEAFFAGLLAAISRGERFSPVDCIRMAKEFLAQFSSRSIGIKDLTHARNDYTVDQLLAWRAGMPDGGSE